MKPSTLPSHPLFSPLLPSPPLLLLKRWYSGHQLTWLFTRPQALQYLRKLCNHPLLVLTANHPEYDKVMDQLHQQNISIRDIQHAAKLVALKYVLLCYHIPVQVIYGNCNSQIVFASPCFKSKDNLNFWSRLWDEENCETQQRIGHDKGTGELIIWEK